MNNQLKTQKKRNNLRKNQFSVNVPKSLGFLPPRVKDTLKWATILNISAATGVYGQNIFLLNSLWRPNTSDTHQPYGFDQMSALYSKYRVYSVKWRVQIGPTSGRLVHAACPMNDVQTTPVVGASSFVLLAESPLSTLHVLGQNGGQVTKFEGNKTLHQFSGRTKPEYDAMDTYAALVSASPAEIIQLVVGYGNPDVATIIHTMSVELWFTSEFFDPVIVGQSLVMKRNLDGSGTKSICADY
jgi:hypothetical protein